MKTVIAMPPASVLLRAGLKKAGAPMEGQLRGPALSSQVIARGHDGYQVVFSLAEPDSSFGNERIIVADRQDGKRCNCAWFVRTIRPGRVG